MARAIPAIGKHQTVMLNSHHADHRYDGFPKQVRDDGCKLFCPSVFIYDTCGQTLDKPHQASLVHRTLTKRHCDSVAILDYASQLCLSLRPVQSGIATSFLLAMTLSNELVVCPSAFQTGTCGQSPDKPIPPLH